MVYSGCLILDDGCGIAASTLSSSTIRHRTPLKHFASLNGGESVSIKLIMQLPVKISYRGLEKSDQIDNLVLDKAARLEKFCDHINRCDVAIEQPNHTHHKGNQYRVRIDVTVSRGHELVANEQQKDNGTHDPLNKVIHDAFKTMERQLRHLVDVQRREVKTHADSRSPK